MAMSPGPWRWQDAPDDDVVLLDARGSAVLAREEGIALWCADAALIAAAPEMRALLRDMAEQFDALSKQVPNNELLRAHLKADTLGRARALSERLAAAEREDDLERARQIDLRPWDGYTEAEVAAARALLTEDDARG